jgi:hypothetical protein
LHGTNGQSCSQLFQKRKSISIANNVSKILTQLQPRCKLQRPPFAALLLSRRLKVTSRAALCALAAIAAAWRQPARVALGSDEPDDLDEKHFFFKN